MGISLSVSGWIISYCITVFETSGFISTIKLIVLFHDLDKTCMGQTQWNFCGIIPCFLLLSLDKQRPKETGQSSMFEQ